MASQIETLELAIDRLIKNYGSSNPELFKDLVSLREELRTVEKQPVNKLKIVQTALRVAECVKYVYDLIDGGPD